MRFKTILLLCLLCMVARGNANAEGKLVDAHLHYNSDHFASVSPDQAIAILRDNGVTQAAVTSYPPMQVLQLHAAAPELILPVLGVYLTPDDKQHWTQDLRVPGRTEKLLQLGVWRGIGELHLFADQRSSPVFLRLVDLASDRQLPLLMHCDPAVIDSLFSHRPDARVIWAHAGAYPYPPLLRDYVDRYPNLYLDLSVREDRISPKGILDAEWESLLWDYPQRFMLGVDTYDAGRWSDYPAVAARIRGWLEQLPRELAEQIAHVNAARLYLKSSR